MARDANYPRSYNIAEFSSRSCSRWRMKLAGSPAGFLFGLFFGLQDGGNMFFRNVGHLSNT
jgi:hypothetical protein